MIPLVKVGLPDKKLLFSELEKVFDSGILAEGELVYQFENKFKSLFGYKSCYAMSSGTACLHAALVASGVEAGDEVVTTSMTAEPTNLSILYSGGVPVFADVDDAGNIAPESIRKKITNKTKAIVVVHYAGYPVNLSAIRKIADDHGLSLIEDCAHSIGAKWGGKCVGSFGDYSIFSFQAIKHMTTVDGGMLVVNSENKDAEFFKRFRWFGMLKGADRTSLDISTLGYKYNLTNVSAAIGLLQLDEILSRVQLHIKNAEIYNARIIDGDCVRKVQVHSLSSPSYWFYTIRCRDSAAMIAKLNQSGVMASKLHKPNHLHSIFNSQGADLPELKQFYEELVHIPSGWWVTENEVEGVLEVLNHGY